MGTDVRPETYKKQCFFESRLVFEGPFKVIFVSGLIFGTFGGPRDPSSMFQHFLRNLKAQGDFCRSAEFHLRQFVMHFSSEAQFFKKQHYSGGGQISEREKMRLRFSMDQHDGKLFLKAAVFKNSKFLIGLRANIGGQIIVLNKQPMISPHSKDASWDN